MNGQNSGFHPVADCCFDPTDCNWSLSTWSCCTTENRCKEGDGDCDYDGQCQDGLVCGRDNCLDMNPGSQFSQYADCCKLEGKKLEVICCITVFGFWYSSRGLKWCAYGISQLVIFFLNASTFVYGFTECFILRNRYMSSISHFRMQLSDYWCFWKWLLFWHLWTNKWKSKG